MARKLMRLLKMQFETTFDDEFNQIFDVRQHQDVSILFADIKGFTGETHSTVEDGQNQFIYKFNVEFENC